MIIKDIHNKFLNMDYRLYMFASIVFLFLCSLPTASIKIEINDPFAYYGKVGLSIILLLNFAVSIVALFLKILIFVALPVVTLNAVLKKISDHRRSFIIIVVCVLLTFLLGVWQHTSLLVTFCGVLMVINLLYTYYIFNIRRDLHPIFAVFVLTFSVWILYLMQILIRL